jgi:Ca2+-binding EF-hand superfamily protein
VLLKTLLLTVARSERNSEQQRQALAKQTAFEVHQSFRRITTSRRNRITSMELLAFLRSNDVEDCSEADTAYIIKYFDSDGDGLLDYEDFL